MTNPFAWDVNECSYTETLNDKGTYPDSDRVGPFSDKPPSCVVFCNKRKR